MFEGFEVRDLDTDRGQIHARVAGAGPPLLLLHGYPQTHLMWHAAAPLLAERFTVVVADLSGYGASLRPEPWLPIIGSQMAAYSDMDDVFRALADPSRRLLLDSLTSAMARRCASWARGSTWLASR